MCGVAGYFGENFSLSPELVMDRMLDAIAHRGPDDRGTAYFSRAGLGHVRLAIIDLAGGKQPMSSNDGRLHISYNGELYNYREIRDKLVKDGCVFNTSSDTETVLLAYRNYGMAAFDEFRGMFALAIWDSHRNEGLLVRDRFGIKPIFYTISSGGLVFSSEIKGILPALQTRPALHLNSLHNLLNFRYIPGNDTLFTGVRHLPPGHYLRWQDGKFKIGAWFEPGKKSGAAEKIETADIRHAMQQAVHRQLVSDVPVGGYLSSGLDSSTILALAKEKIGPAEGGFPTFTVQTGDSPLEARQAAETARYFDVNNYQAPLSYRLEQILPRAIWHLEVPKVNALQTAQVASLARKHVKVALSGLGGDEIFLGYNIHRYLAALHRVNEISPLGATRAVGSSLFNFFGLCGLQYEEFQRLGGLLRKMPDFASVYGIIRNVWDEPGARRRIYGPRMLAENLDDATTTLKTLWPVDTGDPVIAAAEFELRNKMVNDLLLQEDRLSMAFGLEVRVPFLDEDLVALLTSVNRRRRMPGGKLKYLMREVVSAWLPETVLKRPKSGFQVPIHQFFNSHLRPLCNIYLSRQRLEEDGLFNPNFVEGVLSARPHIRLRWHYFLLYMMLGVNIWVDIFERDAKVPEWN